MKDQHKIWFTYIALLILILSLFTISMQYRETKYIYTTDDSNEIVLDNNATIPIIINTPPMVKIVVDKTTGFRPETITFDANVFAADGDNVTYEWNIKYPPFLSKERIDTYNEKNFSVLLWRNGNYVASLTVTDEAGNSVTEHLRIDIKPSKLEVNINSMLYTLTTLTTAINIITFILDFLKGNETANNV